MADYEDQSTYSPDFLNAAHAGLVLLWLVELTMDVLPEKTKVPATIVSALQ
jgi:hypothetical protein